MKKVISLFQLVTAVFCLLLFLSCRPKGDNGVLNSFGDSINKVVQENSIDKNITIDSIVSTYGKAPSLNGICSLATRIVHLKDSLKMDRNTENLTNSKDSILFSPLENQGYEAIKAYKQLLSYGIHLTSAMANIIQNVPKDDTIILPVLPKVKESDFLKLNQFYFLGGGPFLTRVNTDEGETLFKDSQGNTEIRLSCSDNENTKYILDAILHFKTIRLNVTFGPPLRSYDMGPHDVKGIGSLDHELIDRLPVYFLTEEGIVPAFLTSINNKLVPEDLGCVSDNPEVVFACSTLPKKEILGVFIPKDSTPITSCKIIRNDKIWTADVNEDGIPEFAGVSDPFIGINGDTMVHIFWLVNINGEWKIIDQASELDCT
jgi:hypothetical protein